MTASYPQQTNLKPITTSLVNMMSFKCTGGGHEVCVSVKGK